MNYFGLDYLIVYAFLFITLIIGLRAGRGIRDIREYAVANKTFGTGALVLTLLATYLGSDAAWDDVGVVYSSGIIMGISLLAVSGSFILTGIFIAPKAAQFHNCLTMGDLMKEFYGRSSGIITGVLGLLNVVFIVSMELKLLGVICETLLNIPAKFGIILGGLLLAAYTVYGGIRSVVTTDIFQFIILAIFIPLLAYKALGKIGGIQELLQQVPAEKLEVFQHKDFSFYLTLFLLWLIPAGMVDAAMIQRLLMSKSGNQLRKQYLIIAAFDPAFRSMVILLGLAAVVLYPSIEPQQIMHHFIHDLLPTGIKGLTIAGFLAICMASANSYLHAAGLTLTHDIIRPIYERINNTIDEVKWARYTTFLISLLGMYIGINATDLVELYFISLELTAPLLMFPLFSGMMGFRADKQEFYIACAITIVAFVVAKLALPDTYSHIAILIGMAANGLSFFGMHCIRHKGFLIIKRPIGEEVIWKPGKKVFLDKIKDSFPTPKNIIAYSKSKVDQYGAPYRLFGIFILINYTLPYFLWMQTPAQYETAMLYLRVFGGLLCILLIFREKWFDSLLPLFPSFWHFTVMYCLPLTSTVMFLLTGAKLEWVVNIFGVIILLLVLLDWLSALLVSIMGIGLGLLGYKLIAGDLQVSVNFSTQYLMVYQGIFGILIGLLFARRRQNHFDALAIKHQTLAATYQEDKLLLMETFKEKVRLLKTLQLSGIQDLSKAVKLIKTLRKEEANGKKTSSNLPVLLQQLDNILTPMAIALEKIENRATDYLRLDVKAVDIVTLLEQLQEQVPGIILQYHILTSHKQLLCDPIQLRKLLLNTLHMIQKKNPEDTTIYLTIQDSQLTYPIRSISENYTKQIEAIGFCITTEAREQVLQASYPAQMDKASLPIPNMPQEITWVTNQRIIKAHYGYTNLVIDQGTDYAYYLYVIPAKLNEIRPKDMDDPHMELGAELVRADDNYPGAAEQEAGLLKAVQQKTKANLETIKLALEMIKWYHGPKNRYSGEPFYLHPVAVAQIVLAWSPEETTILGALLHDIVEDTPMLLENIDMIFGAEVVKIVDGVTHFESTKESCYKIKLSNHENILMLLEVADQRALYVKLADRLHNIRTIEAHPALAKQKQIAEETLQFYVPLAQALCLEEAVAELKARSLAILNAYVTKTHTLPK